MRVNPTVLACDFCGKTQYDADKLIAGPEPKIPCICNECVLLCVDILSTSSTSTEVAHG